MDAASRVMIFIASGLLVYWGFRVKTLLDADSEIIENTLEIDLWWGRRLWIALRSTWDGNMTQFC